MPLYDIHARLHLTVTAQIEAADEAAAEAMAEDLEFHDWQVSSEWVDVDDVTEVKVPEAK